MRDSAILQKLRVFGAAIVLSVGLASCISAPEVARYMVTYIKKSDQERARELRGLADPNNKGVTGKIWAVLLGNSIIYLPENFPQDLARDEATFMRTAFGAFLSRNDMTYDWLQQALALEGAEVPFSRETFNYYKGYGGAWLADLERRNAGLKARYALYKKRVGALGTSATLIPPEKLRALLVDDKALDSFLTDDYAASTWLRSTIETSAINGGGGLPDFSIILQPVVVGILPALAS